MKVPDEYWAALYLAVLAGILGIQIFLPPSVGLADNSDSVRLIGGEGLTPNYRRQDWYFRYFTPDYVRGAPVPDGTHGQFFTGRLAVWAAEGVGAFKPGGHFDVRWVGFVHLAVYLMEFGLLLGLVRRAPWPVKWGVPAFAVWVFGDVFYAAYLNSLYVDAAGLLCFLAAMLAVTAVAIGRAGAWASVLLAAASLGLAYSKPLNAAVAAVMGLGVALYAVLASEGKRRLWNLGAGAAAMAAGLMAVQGTPYWYSYPALVDTVMMRIAQLPDAAAEVRYFGLEPEDLRFRGQDEFRAGGPGADAGFQHRFAGTRVSTLVAWYLRHPRYALQFLQEDLVGAAPRLRPLPDLEHGYSTGLHARSFCSWSDWQARVLARVPWAAPLVYVFALALAAGLLLYPPWRACGGFGLSVGLTAAAGGIQFLLGSLLDAVETARHLFMFHVTTDVLLTLLLGGALAWASAAVRKRGWPAGRQPGRGSGSRRTSATGA